jgi:proline iminopeptidase
VLHGGLGLDHQLYRRTMAPALSDRFRLVFPDLRGNGRSWPADLATITMEQLADDVVELADRLGLERFVVLGHSYGGFVAQELALRHGARLDGVVLADTTPGQLGSGETESATEQGPQPPPEVVAMMSSIPTTDAELAAGMAELLPAYFHRPEALDLRALEAGTIFRAATMVRGFEVLGGWSSVDRLPTLDVPLLVLVGRHDVFTSWPQAYRIARRVPGARVEVFEESGHFPWIEEPERFFAVLGGWLEGLGRAV